MARGARYAPLLDCLDQVPMSELVMAIRRQSQGFTRGSSAFRGVTQHKTGASLGGEGCPTAPRRPAQHRRT